MIVFLRFSARSSRRFDFSNGVHSVTVSNWIIIITIIGTVDGRRTLQSSKDSRFYCDNDRIYIYAIYTVDRVFLEDEPTIEFLIMSFQNL